MDNLSWPWFLSGMPDLNASPPADEVATIDLEADDDAIISGTTRHTRPLSRIRLPDLNAPPPAVEAIRLPDLNAPPPAVEAATLDLEADGDVIISGTTMHTWPWSRRGMLDLNTPPPGVEVATIDPEADDDAIISSPRASAEAENNAARRNRVRSAVDLDLEDHTSRRKRGRATKELLIDADSFVNLEEVSESAPPPPPAPPREPTFRCPICLNPLVEEVSTKCGHVFCKACLQGAIAAQNNCPTCRRRTTSEDIIRIYLPAINNF